MAFLVAGLGNPGRKYISTRHNLGFKAVDKIAQFLAVKVNREKYQSKYNQTSLGKEKVILVKPQTFINNSGLAVFSFAQFYQIAAERIIVICDDLNLPLGKIRIRRSGSSGGHKGLASVEKWLKTQNFIRLRVGISRPSSGLSFEEYVLSNFSAEEKKEISQKLILIPEVVKTIITEGVSKAMERYNRKSTK
jgi:PTH1 family peptidyl-tRNA hydrolase